MDNQPKEKTEDTPGPIESGKWVAMTIGQFLSTTVDSGDVAVIMRVVEDVPATDPTAKKFARHFDLWTVPDGMFKQMGMKLQVDAWHKTLEAMFKAGLIK